MKDNESNKNKLGEEIFLCRHCGNKTSHILLYQQTKKVHLVEYPPEDKELTENDYVFLFECKTCTGISLKHVFGGSLDVEHYRLGIPFEDIDYLYPSVRSFDEEIPIGLRLVIQEANRVKLISSMAYLILIRKVLEELCKEKGIKEDNLQKSLNKLAETEKLPDIFFESSDKLRLLGNIGAHESMIKINNDEIKLIEEFLFAIIEHIYVMPSKLHKLKEALDKQKRKV